MGEKSVTTFVTTHYMDEAEYCGRLALIYQGKIIALGTPSELKIEDPLTGGAGGGMRSARSGPGPSEEGTLGL